MAESVVQRLIVRRARCYRACFLNGDGLPTLEGNRVLADIRAFARLDHHGFIKDAEGRIDPIGMARIGGRREVALRILQHLNLDETQIRALVEVVNE